MSAIKHLINVLFLGALCASLGLVCGTNLLGPRVAALEAIANEQLLVVDANGTVLGPVDGTGIVFLDLEGLPLVPVGVRRNVLKGSAETVYFFSSDCSGDPYFASDNPDPAETRVFPRTLVLGQAETIFYSNLDVSPEDLGNVGSYLDSQGCSQALAHFNPYLSPGFRASLEPFTPPYSVVTRGELAAQ